jgi:hypothetical protein
MVTPAQVDELVEKLDQEHAALVSIVSSLSDEQARATVHDAVGEDQWSALQQLAHLAMQYRIYALWVEACVAGNDADGTVDLGKVPVTYPPIQIEEANEHRVEEMLAQLEAERTVVPALIARLTFDQYERAGKSPIFDRPMTVFQWLKSYYRHDRMHRDQIEGRKLEYAPNVSGQMSEREFRLTLGRERAQSLANFDEVVAAAREAGLWQPLDQAAAPESKESSRR